MATITRGATVLTPALVVGWDLARESGSIVHRVLGTGDVEVTTRAAGPRAGDLRTFWATEADALAAMEVLAAPGGAWTWDVDTVGPLVAAVVGTLRIAAEDEAGTVWSVTVGVQEVTA